MHHNFRTCSFPNLDGRADMVKMAVCDDDELDLFGFDGLSFDGPAEGVRPVRFTRVDHDDAVALNQIAGRKAEADRMDLQLHIIPQFIRHIKRFLRESQAKILKNRAFIPWIGCFNTIRFHSRLPSMILFYAV